LRDLAGGEIDGIEARGAEAGDLHAGRLGRIAGLKGCGLGDDGAGIHDRIDAAHDDVVDGRGIEPIAVADRFQRFGGKAHRRHLMQGPILLAPAARRAHMVVNENLGHRLISLSARWLCQALEFMRCGQTAYSLFTPTGRSAEQSEAMRGSPAKPEPEGSRSCGAPPHPALRLTFSPLGRR
jgi:hypothetical protein